MTENGTTATARYSISVQGYNPEIGVGLELVWPEPVWTTTTRDIATRHWADLAKRRRNRNLTRLPNGLEFDTYAAGRFPPGCPEMEHSRTRIIFEL